MCRMQEASWAAQLFSWLLSLGVCITFCCCFHWILWHVAFWAWAVTWIARATNSCGLFCKVNFKRLPTAVHWASIGIPAAMENQLLKWCIIRQIVLPPGAGIRKQDAPGGSIYSCTRQEPKQARDLSFKCLHPSALSILLSWISNALKTLLRKSSLQTEDFIKSSAQNVRDWQWQIMKRLTFEIVFLMRTLSRLFCSVQKILPCDFGF